MMPFHILSIDFGTPEYDAAVRLRFEVLRRPLGLDFTPEQLAAEYDHHHLAAFDHRGELIACLVLTPAGQEQVKMRQVAVSPDWQGRGVGRALVEASEALSREKGFARMILHARETAVPFYRKLQYETVGERFEEVNIPHFRMEKPL